MFNIVIMILANIIRCYATYLCMEHFFNKKDVKQIRVICSYFLFVVLTVGGFYLFDNMLVNFITNIIGFSIIISVYKGKIFKKVFMILLLYTVNIVIESSIFFTDPKQFENELIHQGIYECVASICVFFVVLFLCRTVSVKDKSREMDRAISILLLGVPVISIALVLLLLNDETTSDSIVVIESIGLLAINICIFYLYGALQNYYMEKGEKELIEQQTAFYEKQLDILKNSYYNVRTLKHDMRHHLKELKYMTSQENNDKAIRYIEQMEGFVNYSEEYVESGNRDIDSTLNYLLKKADRVLDKPRIHVALPENLDVHMFKLNIILGNLLENAISAAERSVDKYLSIDIKVNKGLLNIKIENSYEHEILVENGKLLTTKTNKKIHGMGLKSVERIIQEQGGTMKIDWNEQIFSVKVMLYLEQ